ncbi:hypothetical protein FC90_GL000116 [Latilactobacillus graminis DSM 20719]|uniref:Uncharacterized protein n=1 Tax=Latilactobacillus graminis DSM 20719 TaxID=1423752 RepID=A0AA89L4Z6_9LACO|nr:hypothetical protein FC90_GL000116 [Latilactobacillus graminis DSM 20719]
MKNSGSNLKLWNTDMKDKPHPIAISKKASGIRGTSCLITLTTMTPTNSSATK